MESWQTSYIIKTFFFFFQIEWILRGSNYSSKSDQTSNDLMINFHQTPLASACPGNLCQVYGLKQRLYLKCRLAYFVFLFSVFSLSSLPWLVHLQPYWTHYGQSEHKWSKSIQQNQRYHLFNPGILIPFQNLATTLPTVQHSRWVTAL